MPSRPGSRPRLSEEEHKKWLLVKAKCDLGEVRLLLQPVLTLIGKDVKDSVEGSADVSLTITLRSSIADFKLVPLLPHLT